MVIFLLGINMISTKRILGLIACLVLLGSCFFGWAYYPDINEEFTGFYSKNNYYGRPGILLGAVAAIGFAAYVFHKVWLYRINLIIAAIGMGYAVKSWLLFSSGYDGFTPQPRAALYVMLASALLHVVMGVLCSTQPRAARPEETSA